MTRRPAPRGALTSLPEKVAIEFNYSTLAEHPFPVDGRVMCRVDETERVVAVVRISHRSDVHWRRG